MNSGASRSINELLAEARRLVGPRPVLADMAEAQARTWKEQLASHPPTSVRDREQYRTKAASIRQLARSQLDNVSEVGTMIAELITRLDELSSSEQAAVLRDQIGPAFGNEAKTVGAAASVLEKSAS
jgi:hypothetical protein